MVSRSPIVSAPHPNRTQKSLFPPAKPSGVPHPQGSRQGYLAAGRARGAAWGPLGGVGPLHRPPGARAEEPGSRRPRRPRRLRDHGQRRRGAVPVFAPPTAAPACWIVPMPVLAWCAWVPSPFNHTRKLECQPLHPGIPPRSPSSVIEPLPPSPQQPLGTLGAISAMVHQEGTLRYQCPL